MKIRRFSTRLILWLLPSAAAILLTAIWLQFLEARDVVIKETRKKTELLAALAEADLNSILDPVEASTSSLAAQLASARLTRERLQPVIVNFITTTHGVYGSTIALEPGVLGPDSEGVAPYAYHDQEGQIHYADLTKQNYRDQEWYRIPRETRSPHWSRPYFDEGGGETLMVTYSAPFDRVVGGSQGFAGVLTADVSLKELAHHLAGGFDEGTELMIVDADGRLISHPNVRWIHTETLESLGERFGEANLPRLLHPTGTGKPISYLSPHLGVQTLGFTQPIPNRNWFLILGVDTEFALREPIAARNRIAAITLVGLVALAILVVVVSRRVTKPVAILAETAHTIASGRLDFDMPEPRGHDEIAGLQHDFLHMRDSLIENIAKLKKETEARQKLESELEIARSIQKGLLPTRASVGGSLREVEIAATLLPAKAVGGDLYNYFYTDDDNLCFAVGDVSDKGVPAALFMARTNTLVRPATRYFKSLNTVLGWLSQELTLGNDDFMFVTILCCSMNLRTGMVSLVNASHLDPVVVRRDGTVELTKIEFGPPLGVTANVNYPTTEITLEIGDTIVLYSDGVTEAMNETNEEYGESRLVELAHTFATKSPTEINDAIVRSVREHAGAATQSDDITILVLRRVKEGASDA